IAALLRPDAEAILAANNFQALQNAVFATSRHAFTPAEKQGFLDSWSRGLHGSLNYYRNFFPNMAPYNARMRGIKM
ncbi:hypothetical protein ACSTIG_23480, partial [Vibrio parahaemolyticus]